MPNNLEQPVVNRESTAQISELIQALADARELADALGLHLCAGLIDQALTQAGR